MLILSLFVLQALSVSFCYDLQQLQGMMILGSEIFRSVEHPADVARLLVSFLPSKIEGKGKLLPKGLEPMLMRANSSKTDKDNTETDLNASILDNVMNKAKTSLHNIGTNAISDLNSLAHILLTYLPSNITGKGKLPKSLEPVVMKATDNVREENIEKENNNSMGKFLAILKQKGKETLKNTGKQLASDLNDVFSGVLLSVIPLYKSGKGKLLQASNATIMRATDDTDIENVDYKIKDPLAQIKKHLEKKVLKTLYNIEAQLITDFNIKKNFTPILEMLSNEYRDKMQDYYDFVKKYQNDSERDLLYLDMVETSCRLLFDEEAKLLNDIIMHEKHHAQNGTFQKMSQKLIKINNKAKKEAIHYVCKTHNVCREYPTFSDYCLDLINEILTLDDGPFHRILDTLTKILKRNKKTLSWISEKQDRDIIMANLLIYSTDLFAAKEFFVIFREAILQRFKTVGSNSVENRIRTKATRIILNVIDKALTAEDELLVIDFDNTLHAIRNWSAHGNINIDFEKNLENLAIRLLKRLKQNLTKDAIKEIKVLIKAVVRGNMQNGDV